MVFMNKLKYTVQFQFLSLLKALAVFYIAIFSVTALGVIVTGLTTGNAYSEMTNMLETNSIIFMSICGAVVFSKDHKFFIQNGFTRKLFFLSSMLSLLAISAFVALIDTAIGQTLHAFLNYRSLFGSAYGYQNIFYNWLWLTLLYFALSSSLYMLVVLIKKLGVVGSIILGVAIVLTIITLLTSSFQLAYKTFRFIKMALGFMPDGTMNVFNPMLSFLIVSLVSSIISFPLVCTIEIK